LSPTRKRIYLWSLIVSWGTEESDEWQIKGWAVIHDGKAAHMHGSQGGGEHPEPM
jgi:hypothetical protein